MLVAFYNAVKICSIIMFGSVCWGANISKLDKKIRLEKIVKKAGHVVGKPL